MESMNKFKILTIVIICMFLFAIAAIYSNTKDVTTGKVQMKNEAQKENLQDAADQTQTAISQNTEGVQDLNTQIEVLNRRIDELSQKLDQDNSSYLNCKIYGTMTENGIESLSEDAAVQEARVNNSDLVITCSL